MSTPANPNADECMHAGCPDVYVLGNLMPGIKAQPLGGGLPRYHLSGGADGLAVTDNKFCSQFLPSFSSLSLNTSHQLYGNSDWLAYPDQVGITSLMG